MECPACGNAISTLLGRLGNLLWFRCHACGIDYNITGEHIHYATLLRELAAEDSDD